jgi:hypothetical protein
MGGKEGKKSSSSVEHGPALFAREIAIMMTLVRCRNHGK